jgi:hypothetical protein
VSNRDPATGAALLVALIVGRYRWAWIVLAFSGSVRLVDWVVHFSDPWWFVLYVAVLALLVSPPMRRYIRPPVALR